jgi:hypothetical protein
MRLTAKQARTFGLAPKTSAGKKKKAPPPHALPMVDDEKAARAALVRAACRAHGIPEPQTEVVFAPGRRWRFDYLWGRVALEVEGGVWTRGRHTRGAGFLKDVEKYNAAALLGYTVLRCTPADIESGAAFALVAKALAVLAKARESLLLNGSLAAEAKRV